jgi:UPF0176 protein
MKMDFSPDVKTIGECEGCGGATSNFHDCSSLACRDLVLLCDACVAKPENLACKPEHTRGKRIGATVG